MQQLHRWNYATRTAGLPRTHGLMHAYAQRRYLEETTWKPPTLGEPTHRALSNVAKYIDRVARQRIAEELGHSRINITNNYLGQ